MRLSDAKEWLIRLQQVDKKSFSTIHTIRGVVRLAFQLAVDDDLLRKNPFEFQMVSVLVNDTATREAITRKQERTFLEFIKNDSHYCRYYDGMYILFKTGMRISEFTGLTVHDLDMENRTINIDHLLQKTGTLVYIDTTHVCRHTYCSNMAKSGMNPKVLQYLMGHSDISVTLNTYTHLKLDDAKEEMEKLAQKQAEADEEIQKLGVKENEHSVIMLRKSS